MTSSNLYTTKFINVLKGVAKSGLFRVVVELRTGAENSGSQIPDVELWFYFLGKQVLHHIFVI